MFARSRRNPGQDICLIVGRLGKLIVRYIYTAIILETETVHVEQLFNDAFAVRTKFALLNDRSDSVSLSNES